MTVKFNDFVVRLDRAQEYDKYVSGMCPFEQHSSPAMLVFKDGWFRCLSCGRSGSWTQLWDKIQGQNIIVRPEGKTAWKGPVISSDLESMCYQAHLDLIQFSSYKWYLQERGLEGRIEINELGYYEGWYSIPVRSEDGNFITSVFRAAPHIQTTTGMRYYCRHVPVPFIPDYNLLGHFDYIFVVYGIFDALTLADLRLPVVTSTAGKDTFNPEWLSSHRKRIFIIPDKGEEDTAYGLASQLDFRGKVINLDYPEHIKDCNGFYEHKKGELLQKQLLNVTRRN